MSRSGQNGYNLQVEVIEYFVRQGFEREGCVSRFQNELNRKGISSMNVSLTVLDLQRPWYVFTDTSSYRPININFLANGSSYNDSDIAECWATAVVNNLAEFNTSANRTFEVDATEMGKVRVIEAVKQAIVSNRSLRNIRGSVIGYCGYSVRTTSTTRQPSNNTNNNTNNSSDEQQEDPGFLESISESFSRVTSSASRRIDASTEQARNSAQEAGGVLSNLGNAINTGAQTANSILGDTSFVKTATYVVLGGFGILVVVKGIAEVRKFIQPYSK